MTITILFFFLPLHFDHYEDLTVYFLQLSLVLFFSQRASLYVYILFKVTFQGKYYSFGRYRTEPFTILECVRVSIINLFGHVVIRQCATDYSYQHMHGALFGRPSLLYCKTCQLCKRYKYTNASLSVFLLPSMLQRYKCYQPVCLIQC